MCEAVQEYQTPRAKADPTLDILESVFSRLLCLAEGEVSMSPVTQQSILQKAKEKRKSRMLQ